MTSNKSLDDSTATPLEPSFGEIGLPDVLLQATNELGYESCTEIQGLTLPVIENGQDIAAQAQTGTGKTAAFLLGGFARLLSRPASDRRTDQPRMLVIAPTRELAIQIKKDADALGAHTGLSFVVVYGGIDYNKQRKQLADGVDVLIGTPGRLIDYFKQKIFNLQKLEIVVLDEADRMFDLGFIADIRFLLRRMPAPPDRQSMLFSATLSHRVMELAYEHMNNPHMIKTETDAVTATGVRQILYQPASEEKIPLLLGLLEKLAPPRAIIFVNTKRAAEDVESYLSGNNTACGTLSGDVRQSKRQRILSDFTLGELPVLIATDVAARGLHIDDVSHVFNYDLPQQAEDYVHRIGRTARAGTEGVAVSFACENYSFSLPDIQEYIGQSIPLAMIDDELLKPVKPPKRKPVKRKSAATGKAKPGSERSDRSRRKRKPNRDPSRRSDSAAAGEVGEKTNLLDKAATNSNEKDAQASAGTKQSKSGARRRRRRRRPSNDTNANSADAANTSNDNKTTPSDVTPAAD